MRWLQNGGACFSKLHVGPGEDGERGTFARGAIAPGEQVLSVPARFVLTDVRARHSAMGRLIHSALPSSAAYIYLSAFLLAECSRPRSFWRPFLDVLPTSYAHMPACYGPREQALLEGSCLRWRVEAMHEDLQSEYNELCQRLPGFSRFSYQGWVWARLVVLTRAFGLWVGEERLTALVPLADMLNHRPAADVSWEARPERGEAGFALVAQRQVAQGAPLYTSYGDRTGAQMLLNYGFYPVGDVVEEQEEFGLVLGLSEEDGWHSTRRRLLELGSYSARRYMVPWRYEDKVKELLAALRILQASPEELGGLAAAPEPLQLATEPLSLANEERVLEALASACEERLEQFPTPEEESERLLEEGGLDFVARGCVAMRRTEQRLLRRCLEQVRTWRAVLRRPWPERVREAEALCAEAGSMAGYLRGPFSDVAPTADWARRHKAARLGVRLACPLSTPCPGRRPLAHEQLPDTPLDVSPTLLPRRLPGAAAAPARAARPGRARGAPPHARVEGAGTASSPPRALRALRAHRLRAGRAPAGRGHGAGCAAARALRPGSRRLRAPLPHLLPGAGGPAWRLLGGARPL
jgi:protein-histidine N-methyltransferase